MRRFVLAYLWFSPLAFVVLFGLYHGASLWAGVAGGAVHLALVVWGMYAGAAFNHEEESGSKLGVALLLIGGAVVWATGPSGPPTAANLPVAVYNNAGLTLGFFITLLGFAALLPALVSLPDRALGSIGLVCFILMFVIWLLQSALAFVLTSSPLAGATAAQRPDWFQLLRTFANSLGWRISPGGYIAGVTLSEVAIRAGWVKRGLGRLMSAYCALGLLLAPLGLIVVARSTATSVSELPVTAFLLLPFLPPATMCLVPYYVGVLGFRSNRKVMGKAIV